ncbi:MAG: HAMP domain-containing protein, partial [Gammaproteobacteria bacterium]|nr:HAMP domain-containing protein [Gammaproteobacteria bacterium]
MSEHRRRSRHSLGRSLLMWFLLLALLPLSINAWLGYRQAADGLTAMAIEELEQGAKLKAQLIQIWFGYRFMDLRSQAESRRNAQFLTALRDALERSGQPLDKFVNGDTWAALVDARQQDLMTFIRRYDYLYDLFLIDRDGNILFSAEREFDLGSNIFGGPYAQTRFAKIAKTSLETGQALFSDFEGHAASNVLLTGFLTAPLLNESGETIGVFAIQLQLERIRALMLGHSGDSSLNHYLVGEDGFLRTPLAGQGMDSVLRERIDTEQFRRWQQDRGDGGLESASAYRGPAGQQVIGLRQSLQLPGVSWVLISEIDRDEALAAAHRLGWVTLVIFLLTGTLAALLAIYQARRITRPITLLADASRAVAAGDLDQQVVIQANNEIGLLADAFNEMLSVRKRHMNVLEESNDIAQMAMAELAEQKFALDQHAIVAITDVHGTITFANKKFSEISG